MKKVFKIKGLKRLRGRGLRYVHLHRGERVENASVSITNMDWEPFSSSVVYFSLLPFALRVNPKKIKADALLSFENLSFSTIFV